VKIPLDWATTYQVQHLFSKFYPEAAEEQRNKFVEMVRFILIYILIVKLTALDRSQRTQ